MHSPYDIAHTREDAIKAMTPAEVVEKYSKSAEVSKLADEFDEKIMEAARQGKPAVIIYEAEVAAALSKLEGKEGYADGARFATTRLVEWLRRGTQLRAIRYVGTDADFIIEI